MKNTEKVLDLLVGDHRPDPEHAKPAAELLQCLMVTGVQGLIITRLKDGISVIRRKFTDPVYIANAFQAMCLAFPEVTHAINVSAITALDDQCRPDCTTNEFDDAYICGYCLGLMEFICFEWPPENPRHDPFIEQRESMLGQLTGMLSASLRGMHPSKPFDKDYAGRLSNTISLFSQVVGPARLAKALLGIQQYKVFDVLTLPPEKLNGAHKLMYQLSLKVFNSQCLAQQFKMLSVVAELTPTASS